MSECSSFYNCVVTKYGGNCNFTTADVCFVTDWLQQNILCKYACVFNSV